MSHQRRRGQLIAVWRTEDVTDNRGNVTTRATPVNPHMVRAAIIPQRSAKAELPGQQHINVTRILIPADLEDVNLWSRVVWNGEHWDIVTPPAYHHGTRHSRHWSIDIRQRP